MTASHCSSRGLLAVAVLGAALGCEDPLKKAQLLEEPRVLGVRVNGPDGEADLRPGQNTELSVLLAGPEGPVSANFSYRVCEAKDSARGVPTCAKDAFAEAEVTLDDSPLELSVPASLGPDRRVAVLGVACAQGEARLPRDPNAWRCAGSGSALRLSFDLYTRDSERVNINPDLAELSVRVGRTAVPLQNVSTQAQCADGVIEVARGKQHSLTISVPPTARETFVDAEENRKEALQLSHFATRGELDRQFSFIDAGASTSSVELDWKAPSKAGPAKQYLVVRDERGGVSWASWTLCVR